MRRRLLEREAGYMYLRLLSVRYITNLESIPGRNSSLHCRFQRHSVALQNTGARLGLTCRYILANPGDRRTRLGLECYLESMCMGKCAAPARLLGWPASARKTRRFLRHMYLLGSDQLRNDRDIENAERVRVSSLPDNDHATCALQWSRMHFNGEVKTQRRVPR